VTITFSGLATGIDTDSLISQLVAVERVPADQLTTRKTNANRRMSAVSDLIAKLTALRGARKAVDTASELNAVTAASTDPARVAVTASGAAQEGQLSLRVHTLARAETRASTTFGSGADLVPGAGLLSIQVGSGEQVVVDFTTQDTIADVARRINERVDGVRAALVDNGSGVRLTLTSERSGTAHALTIDEAGTSLGLLASGSRVAEAQDATFSLNGVEMVRSSNTVADAVTGVTLQLRGTHAEGDPDTSVTIASDPAGIQSRVQSVVDAFNAAADAVGAHLRYDGVKKGEDTLFGDSTVRGLQRALSELATGGYAHGTGTISLGRLGVRLGRDGRLSVDADALGKALADDPSALEDLLLGEGGLGAAIDDVVARYTRAGDGLLTAKKQALSSEMSRYDDQIEKIEARATRIGDHLRAQFTALESLMSDLKSQQASLTAYFG
jgi:flagellar hook-associated protein 2